MKLEKVKVLNACLEEKSGIAQNGNEWKKKTIIVECQDEFKKTIAVDLWGNLCKLQIEVGAVLDISINIESKEYNGKYYTNIKAWKIDLVGTTTSQVAPPPPPPTEVETVESSDLPF